MTVAEYISLHQRELRNISRTYGWRYKVDVDDVHQELMIKLIKGQNSYVEDRGLETFTAWASRTCINLCIDMWRRPRNISHKHTKVDITCALWVKGCQDSDRIILRQHLARVFWAIRQKWPRKRKISHVAYDVAYGFTYNDMVVRHNLSLNIVKSYIYKIRQYITPIT